MAVNSNDKMVSSLRTHLRNLANRRSNGVVSADDAHVFLTKRGISSTNSSQRLSLINSAFMGGNFTRSGQMRSTRPAAKGRTITEWQSAS